MPMLTDGEAASQQQLLCSCSSPQHKGDGHLQREQQGEHCTASEPVGSQGCPAAAEGNACRQLSSPGFHSAADNREISDSLQSREALPPAQQGQGISDRIRAIDMANTSLKECSFLVR